MKDEIRSEWVDRLLSKQYNQMGGALKHVLPIKGKDGSNSLVVCYDALGILIEMYRESMMKQYKTLGVELAGEWVQPDTDSNYCGFKPHESKKIEYSCLPDCVRVWAGMIECDPEIYRTRENIPAIQRINDERLSNRQPLIFEDRTVFSLSIRRLTDKYYLSFTHLALLIATSKL